MQREVITAPSLVLEVTVVTEVAPVQLVVQEVKIEGRPDCVVMYDTGSQSILVLNSYAKEASLKRIGVSNVCVRGMGVGTVEPDNLYEVPLVKREGEVTRIKAHGVREIVGELPALNLTPVKQAFVNVPENEIVVPKGAVQLLVGLDHLYLHPVEVERTGSLALFLSFFSVRTGWIVAGNLAEGAKVQYS
jgi:hypothetical protein